MAVTLATYAPFDSGAGSAVTEDTWRKFMRHMLGSASGIIRGFQNEFAPSAAGTGMTVTVDTGECWMRGHYGENAPLQTLPITAAHATLARKDRIVLRADFVVNNRIELDVLTGTAAGSPTVPSLTQTTSLWETSVGIVDIPAADTVISSGQVTDDRMYTSAQARHSKQSATQSAGNGVYTQITFATVLSRSGDISYNTSTGTFTLLRSGCWVLVAACRVAASGAGTKRQILISDPANVSGGTATDTFGAQSGPPAASIETHVSCTAVQRFPANQNVGAWLFQDTGGALNILGGTENGTFFSAVWVGP